jgi:hypothetical protein
MILDTKSLSSIKAEKSQYVPDLGTIDDTQREGTTSYTTTKLPWMSNTLITNER